MDSREGPDVSVPAGAIAEGKADHFQLLGLARQFRVDLDGLEARYLALSKGLHPDRFVGRPESEQTASLKLSAAVNEAASTLRDPWRRAEYLLSLLATGGEAGASNRRTPPGFVEEMLELREAVAEAKSAGDRAKLASVHDAIGLRQAELLLTVERQFDCLEAATDAAAREARASDIRLTLNAGAFFATLLREAAQP